MKRLSVLQAQAAAQRRRQQPPGECGGRASLVEAGDHQSRGIVQGQLEPAHQFDRARFAVDADRLSGDFARQQLDGVAESNLRSSAGRCAGLRLRAELLGEAPQRLRQGSIRPAVAQHELAVQPEHEVVNRRGPRRDRPQLPASVAAVASRRTGRGSRHRQPSPERRPRGHPGASRRSLRERSRWCRDRGP